MKLIKHFFLVLFLFFIIQSCNNRKQITPKQETKKAATHAKPEAKPTIVPQKVIPKKSLVTNKNVKNFLLAYGEKNQENLVKMTTDFGVLKLKLYKSTPLHRANFIRLVKSGFYNKTYFYRVVQDFVIQGGDNDDDDRKTQKDAIGRYTIPAEFSENIFHKKGALAMTRDYKNNPNKRSSAFDFYIVQGERYSNFQLDALENEYKIEIDETKREIYRKDGGTPHLDNEHTVFGEVIEGFDVIDKIAVVKTDRSDWPVNDVYIQKIEIIK